MTLYGVGLGPGDADLVTVRGRRVLADADAVYSPGRLSRSVATEHVPADRIGDLDFPMTRDPDELRRAWKAAAAEIAPTAREGDAAFVTLGDPNVYSTFGHLRRTVATFHPEVDLEIVPGVSAVTAFTTALGVEIDAGAGLALREAARGASPTGPDRMILFKVTDAPATHEGLVEAGYDVTYGRRLYMEQGETLVTDDPEAVADRDYYTLAYAEKRDLEKDRPTAAFDAPVAADGGPAPGRTPDRSGSTASEDTGVDSTDADGADGDAPAPEADDCDPDAGSEAVSAELAEAAEGGDYVGDEL